jgi:hypothetical protein
VNISADDRESEITLFGTHLDKISYLIDEWGLRKGEVLHSEFILLGTISACSGMILEKHIRIAGDGCEAIICNVGVIHGGIVDCVLPIYICPGVNYPAFIPFHPRSHSAIWPPRRIKIGGSACRGKKT